MRILKIQLANTIGTVGIIFIAILILIIRGTVPENNPYKIPIMLFLWGFQIIGAIIFYTILAYKIKRLFDNA
jgi:tellurite resistance protein TehA-like permease